jgi:uncharacterized repeat protein (TIGR01451 family)
MHPPRRSSILTFVFLLAVITSVVWANGRIVPTAQAQTKPRVVYVYDTDTVSRDSFKTLLTLRGYDVTTVTPSAITLDEVDWTGVQALIIGDDTNDPATTYAWAGRTDLVPDNIYVIGIGYGGATFFEEDQDPTNDITGVPAIGFSNSAPGTGKSIIAVSPGAAIWNSPTPIALSPSGLADLYSKPVSLLAPNLPAAVAGVTPIGRQVNDATHYPLIAQSFSGQFGPWCGLLWGFRRPPSQMTNAGRDLFINLVKNNACTSNNGTAVDVGINKLAPQSGTVGQPLTYTLTVKNNGRTTAPGVKAVDTLPANVVFVSASSTQGSCSYAAGKVTCQIGTMAGGATVTITIVVKPSEAGTIYNLATVSARARDTNDKNDSSSTQTAISNPPLFTNINALAYQAIFNGPILTLPNQDLSIFGIEVTQGIQCFDTSKGLASCPNNSLSLVSKKDSAARIYLKYTGSASSLNNVPVRLHIIDAEGDEVIANVTGKALPSIDQSSISNSANVYFYVNYNASPSIKFWAEVDPSHTIFETNESNNRFPASGFMTIKFNTRKSMKIVGDRLRYHPSGYSGTQYAGGWAVNGGAADWFEQVLPIRNGGINYVVKSGYKNWTTTLNSDGQHALIQSLNSNWLWENIFPWLFSGTFTGARHVYGWAPDAGYGGGHADMPVYPHAGGLGIVGIGTDEPGTNTDNPGAGTLIFGHELVHDYNLMHTDTADSCGSSDSNSDFPYGSSSIQEFGFNPITGKVYNPSNTHDLMSYCPAGGSKLGWIAPFTWQRMFNNLNPSLAQTSQVTTDTSVLAIDVSVSNPAQGPDSGVFNSLAKVDVPAPLVTPTPGDYAIELRDSGDQLLSTIPFSVTFKSEYTATSPERPGDPSARPIASATMSVPWVDGTTSIVLRHGADILATQPVSPNAPQVQITSPGTAANWPAGTIQTLTWDAEDADAGDNLTYSIFYSHDGINWALLETGLTEKTYQVAVDSLAGGSEARFRVIASDGVNIGDDETDFPINVPDKAPTALILNPTTGAQALPGDLVVLMGTGNDFEDGTLPDLSLAWSSDRQGALGTGESVATNTLQNGAHTITLTVTDSQGHTSTATTNIFIGPQLHLPLVQR